jgi:hypothetical protein
VSVPQRGTRTLVERAVVVVVALTVELGLTRVDAGRMTLERLCAKLGIRLDLQSPDGAGGEPAVLPTPALHAVEAVDAVMRRWRGRDTCLRRCLVLGQRLRRLRPVLRIGARRDGAALVAHAWLEIDGRSLDADSGNYAVLRR